MTDTMTTTGSAEGEAVDARYRDASLPIADRVEILLSQMTLAEKAGLFFQTMITIGAGGELAGVDPMFGLPSTEEYVLGRGMTHFNVLGAAPTGRQMADGTTACRSWPRRPASASPSPSRPTRATRSATTPAPRSWRVPSRSGPSRSALRRSATRRLVTHVRRHRAPGVPGGRHPRGAAPAGRPRHRAALVAPGRDLRRGRRAVGPAGRGLRPRVPGRRARARLGRRP